MQRVAGSIIAAAIPALIRSRFHQGCHRNVAEKMLSCALHSG